MTEEEAKTKWCPHAVASHTNPRTGFDDATKDIPPVFPCIASACMAWRATDNECGPSAPGEPMPPFKPAGYCGLAGKP